MRVFALPLLLLAGACATTPHAWQRPETGKFATAEEINACRMEADREARRSAMLWGWPSAGFGVGYGRARGPGWGWGGGGWMSYNLAISQRAFELTDFCLRIQGFRYLPVEPAVKPSDATRPAPQAETPSATPPETAVGAPPPPRPDSPEKPQP
jgi:hypothetical protein